MAPGICGRSSMRSMTKSRRNVGLEILKGLRELKRGEHGRIVAINKPAGVSIDSVKIPHVGRLARSRAKS
jgi:hypothetical protein